MSEFLYKVYLESRSYGYLMRWTDMNGQSQSESTRTKNRAKAERMKRKKEKVLNSGMKMQMITRPTFDDLMKELELLFKPGVKESYWKTVTSAMKQLRKHAGVHLDTVTALVAAKLRAHVRSKNCARTWNKHRGVLQSVFNVAKSWGYVETNVFNAMRKDREPEQEIRFVTAEEEAAIMTACKTPRDRMIVILARYGALRAEEIARLHIVEDMDKETGRIDIRNRPDAFTKTYARRSVYIGESRIPELCKFVKTWRRKRGHNGTEYPFYNRVGTRVSARFCILKKYAGINGFKLHDLRKTCATEMLYAGRQPKEVADFLGHSVEVLLRVYAAILSDRMRITREETDSKRVSEGC